jgi:hypothetical protein
MFYYPIKIAIFTIYLVVIVSVVDGVKDYVLSNFDTSSFMTPTICYFLNELNAFSLISAYFGFMSINWLKSKVIQYWSN